MDLVVGVKHTLLTIELMSKLASKLPSLAGGKFLLGLIDVQFAVFFAAGLWKKIAVKW